MPGVVPTESEVLGYFDSSQQLGPLGPRRPARDAQLHHARAPAPAASLVRDGRTVSCARLIPTGRSRRTSTPRPRNLRHQQRRRSGRPGHPADALQSSGDFIGLAFHGFSITHVDSLCHIFRDGRMYNGHPSGLVSTAAGAAVLSVDAVRDGIVGRGVLLDIARLRGVDWLDPSEGVFPEDLEAAEAAAGVTVGPGDVLLCRFGAVAMRNALGPSKEVFARRPGLHAACCPWLHERQVVALGSDSAQDLFPSGYTAVRAPAPGGHRGHGPVAHRHCDLEALGRACAETGRAEFLVSIGTLRIEHGTGSPVNPIAVL